MIFFKTISFFCLCMCVFVPLDTWATQQAIPNTFEVGLLARAKTSSHSKGLQPKVSSHSAILIDQATGKVLYRKNSRKRTPIASLTKLMTAMVTLDRKLSLTKTIKIGSHDIDLLKGTRSRLPVGTRLTRKQLLHLALMSSENRAASALAHSDPKGYQAFIQAMNRKAKKLGMINSHFVDSTGLSPNNISTAEDLAILARNAYRYRLIRQMTTTTTKYVSHGNKQLKYINTNRLVRKQKWQIGLSKTGYIQEAGRCLILQTHFENRPVILVLLNAQGKYTPLGDADRLRIWLQIQEKRNTVRLTEAG